VLMWACPGREKDASDMLQVVERLDRFVEQNDTIFKTGHRPTPNLDDKQLQLITKHVEGQTTELESLTKRVEALLLAAPK
jgi:hypothetical protein